MVLAAVLMGVIAARIHLLQVPLERDEGEYAYAGQLMLEGFPPYKLAYNMKFPGTYVAYALVMSIFGQTTTGVHLGVTLINLVTVAFVFLLGRRLINNVCGAAAASVYAVLSVSPSVLGFAGHATHFVMLPVCAGSYLLVTTRRSNVRVFAAGLLFGTALVMKQSGAAFAVFGAILLAFRDSKASFSWGRIVVRLAAFGLAVVLPISGIMIWLWSIGSFGAFWFWTVQYAREYIGLLPVAQGVLIFRQAIVDVAGLSWPVWLLAIVGFVFAIIQPRTRSIALSVLLPLLLCSALAISPGFYFRPHYFIQVLPAVALLAAAPVGLMTATARSSWRGWIALVVFAIAVSFPIWQERVFLFVLSPDIASRAAYGLEPFPEAKRVGEFLRQRSNPGDTIAVLGSEPEIYFYARRHSATGYIYSYPLMERQAFASTMQRTMISEIESAHPRYFVLVGFPNSWMRRTDSDQYILQWFNRYAAENLTGIGALNARSIEQTEYYLPYNGEPLQMAENYMLIYERR